MNYINNIPLMMEFFKNMHIIINPLCTDKNYIINKMKEDFPNFIYEDSCFTLLELFNNKNIDIFDGIFYLIDDENIEFDLSDENSRIQFCCNEGYTFLLKKYLDYLINISYEINYEKAFIEAIKNHRIEAIKVLLQFNQNLITDNILYYIDTISSYTIRNNIHFFGFLIQRFPQIGDVIILDEYNYTNNLLDYDKIINNLESIFIDKNNIIDCPICYENNSTLITECNHQYCISCIKKWWITQKAIIHICPYCKSSIEPKKCKKII
jgi:hypothetical protein